MYVRANPTLAHWHTVCFLDRRRGRNSPGSAKTSDPVPPPPLARDERLLREWSRGRRSTFVRLLSSDGCAACSRWRSSRSSSGSSTAPTTSPSDRMRPRHHRRARRARRPIPPSPQDSGPPTTNGDASNPDAATGSPLSGECGPDCTCKGQEECRFTCPAGRCRLTCTDESDCKLTCARGSQCTIACSGRSDCNMDCSATGATCTFECREDADCQGKCGRGAVCTRLCSQRCDIDCSDGAICR